MADSLKVNNKTARTLTAEDGAGNFEAANIPPGGNAVIELNLSAGAKLVSVAPLPLTAPEAEVSTGEIDVTEVDGALVVTPIGG